MDPYPRATIIRTRSVHSALIDRAIAEATVPSLNRVTMVNTRTAMRTTHAALRGSFSSDDVRAEAIVVVKP